MIAERSAARVALLADTFHEVNGAARTCREWEAFACRNDRPFLCVRWGASPGIRQEGSVRILEMARSRLSFRIDTDLRFDALFHRVLDPIHKELERFRPDAIHVTSPGDLGISGAILAERLKIPLVLSWHTNLHEFAGRRMRPMAAWLGDRASGFAAGKTERFVLDRVCWFFGRGAAIFAPNPELAAMLRERTWQARLPDGRGIDTSLFHPRRRHRDGRCAGAWLRGPVDAGEESASSVASG